jgi:RNA polymerase primary sigma factor
MSKVYVNVNGDDSISKYFKDVRKSELLTSEEEIKLAERILDGDEKAIDRLVNSNLKFVISVAKEYQGQGLALPDLINEGNYGLVKAATRFDHTKGFRFISYAVWWIRQSIIQSLNDNARMIRLPSNVINKISTMKKEIEKFKLQNEREPIYGDLFDDEGNLIDIFSGPMCSSLNEAINEEGDELYLLLEDKDALEEENFYGVDERVKDEIDKVLSSLSDREREIIECYYGINKDYDSMTLEAIGDKYNLTKERIRQIKEKAIRKIRHNAHGLFDALNE